MRATLLPYLSLTGIWDFETVWMQILRTSHSDRIEHCRGTPQASSNSDIRSSLLWVKNSRCTALAQEIFDTIPLESHFVGGTLVQNWPHAATGLRRDTAVTYL